MGESRREGKHSDGGGHDVALARSGASQGNGVREQGARVRMTGVAMERWNGGESSVAWLRLHGGASAWRR
jgi:hypothetical protein